MATKTEYFTIMRDKSDFREVRQRIDDASGKLYCERVKVSELLLDLDAIAFQ